MPSEILPIHTRVSTQLLRRHFRQFVPANMKGAGEATIEHDFELDTDGVREIVGCQYRQGELRFEIAAGLARSRVGVIISITKGSWG